MKTIDFHVHASTQRGIYGLDHYAAEPYLATMDAANIDISVILPLDGLWWPTSQSNDALAQWCKPFPDRLISFGTVDARQPGATEEMIRCVTDLGIRGFKFHPWAQGFNMLDPMWRPIFETARDLDVPVILHDGTPPDSSPLQVGQLAIEVPGLQVVLGHGGLHDLWPEAIEATRLSPTVFLCMTSLSRGTIQRIVDEVAPEQLMAGSDGGLTSHPFQQYVLDRWIDLRAVEMSDSTRRSVEYDTAAKLLGLERGLA